MFEYSRCIIEELISSPINSDRGIKLSLDTPLNNGLGLNILRPAVLRQYYGVEIEKEHGHVKCYTYGSGSGTSSVGMDPRNFVTRSWNKWILHMSNDIHNVLCQNLEKFNMVGCNMTQKFNHCTILIYYAGHGLKEYTSLGYHTDCVYSATTGEYVSELNSTALVNTHFTPKGWKSTDVEASLTAVKLRDFL